VAAGPAPLPGDRGLQWAGWVVVGCAVLLVSGLFMGFQWDELLADVLPSEALYVVIVAAVVLGAGVCLLVPGTRWLAGAGLLLGVAAAATKGLVTLVTFAAEFGGGLGDGYQVELVAHLLLVVAACLVVVALARSGRYRLVIGSRGVGARGWWCCSARPGRWPCSCMSCGSRRSGPRRTGSRPRCG
jgi:uncharacterized protein (DUF486 family)